MSMTLNERNPNVSRIPIGSQVSSASVVIPGLYFRKHARIKNVYYADGAAISASSSNYLTVKLQDNASTPVVYAKAATSDAAVVANTQYAMALQSAVIDLTVDAPSTPAAQQEADVPAGTMLNVSLAGLGTAVATNACVIVEWYPL